MFCPNCGAKNEDTSSFCMQCGAPLKAAAPKEETAAPQQVTPNEIPQSVPQQAPANEVPQSAPQQAPANEVPQSAPQQAPVNGAADSAPQQAPVNGDADSAPQQAPAGAYGASQQPYNAQQPYNGYNNSNVQTSTPPKKGNAAPIIITVAIVAVISVIAILLTTVFGGRSYKKTVKQFMNVLTNMEFVNLPDLVPDDALEELLDEYDLTKSEMKDELQEACDEIQEDVEDMGLEDVLKLRYEIGDTKELSGSELRAIKEDLKDYYNLHIDDAMVVEIILTLEGMDELGINENSEDLILVKCGRNWYISPEYLDEYLY